MEWISVKDKLPKEDETVLVFDGVINLGRYGSERGKNKKLFWGYNIDWDGGSLPIKCTHWMPLPESPKEK